MTDARMAAFADELRKIALPMSAYGALLGGGIGLARGVGKETALRHEEEGYLPPEVLQKARRERLKYLVANAGAGALGGGLIGHGAHRIGRGIVGGLEEGIMSGAKSAVGALAERGRVAGAAGTAEAAKKTVAKPGFFGRIFGKKEAAK